MMDKVKKDFDKGRKSLSRLPLGMMVMLQDRPTGTKTGRWSRKGIIVEVKRGRNTYKVEADGRRYLRNRRFLRPCFRQFGEEEDEPAWADTPNSEPEELRRSERIKGKKAEK